MKRGEEHLISFSGRQQPRFRIVVWWVLDPGLDPTTVSPSIIAKQSGSSYNLFSETDGLVVRDPNMVSGPSKAFLLPLERSSTHFASLVEK